MTTQTKTNNFNYLIDPTFNKVNRLFVLSFENEDEKFFFFKVLNTKSWNKRFQCINWWKKFFWCASKNQKRNMWKIIEIGKNNDYTTGNLLNYEYFSKHYKLFAIDLNKYIELKIPDVRQQNNFVGKLEEDEATIFFIIEK